MVQSSNPDKAEVQDISEILVFLVQGLSLICLALS